MRGEEAGTGELHAYPSDGTWPHVGPFVVACGCVREGSVKVVVVVKLGVGVLIVDVSISEQVSSFSLPHLLSFLLSHLLPNSHSLQL